MGILAKLDALLEAYLKGVQFRNAMQAIQLRDNLAQIEWRLSLCESALPHDAGCALHIARQLNQSPELKGA